MQDEKVIIDLTELVNPPHTDSISGRAFGEKHAEDVKLNDLIKGNKKIVLRINDQYVKAINDSFIKGFFREAFEQLKTAQRIRETFIIDANDYFKKLFEKNWRILEAIENV